MITGLQQLERALAMRNKADGALEREHCAKLAEYLAEKWEAAAVKMRADGEFAYADQAKALDAAAFGLRTVAQGCRDGWDVNNLAVAKSLGRKAAKL